MLALGNLALNTGIVYVLIDKLDVEYLLAQTVGAGIIAVDSFFFYRAFIFKSSVPSGEVGGL
jgi:putative flippase GtrA